MDWTKSMAQSFEFYEVDPLTWKDKRKLNKVLDCSITYDGEAESIGSASLTLSENLGECYVRIYLIATQNGISNKIPLGTVLLQTPSVEFDGKSDSISVDGYSPLIELKEKVPPIGYTLMVDEDALSRAFQIMAHNMRGQVIRPNEQYLLSDYFVAEDSDTWLSFLSDLLRMIGYHLKLDGLGRAMIAPDQQTNALNSVWTYSDDNSSILYPEISIERDLYGIPNVVEVVYSSDEGFLTSRAVNNSESSPTSVKNRGREIVFRETSPELDNPSQLELDFYAQKLLKEQSVLEYRLTYKHGYCPVRIGDCVTLNYERAGLHNIKAKVVSQTIKCSSGCEVEETAVFTKKMWEG